MSLRRRLALTFIALTAAGSIVFGILSLVIINFSLRTAVDAKLVTLARAVADVVDDRNGHAYVDGDDIRQIRQLADRDEHFAIVDRGGEIILGEPVPSGTNARGYRFARAAAIHRGHDDGYVVTWRDARFLDDIVRIALLAFFGAALVLGTFAFIFSGMYARAILTPVERVAALAERIETADLAQRLNAQGRDELARLCRSFDRMLERLQASFDAQRRFVADASHELRTPLAVVRAETDLALRRPRSDREYRSALESIDREAQRLEELVDQLLQTMRTTALVETRPFDLREVLSDLLARVRNAADELHVRDAGDDATVLGDRGSLERAVSAVVYNAITHGGGHVDVTLRTTQESVQLAIADGGAGFTDAALLHATKRFWRGDSARSRGGTGLGLAIAKVLVEAHGGSIALNNGARGGAIVTITLPRAFALTTA